MELSHQPGFDLRPWRIHYPMSSQPNEEEKTKRSKDLQGGVGGGVSEEGLLIDGAGSL